MSRDDGYEDVMGLVQRRMLVQRGRELGRQCRREWERNFMVLVAMGFLMAVVVAAIARGVDVVREGRWRRGRSELAAEQQHLVETWRAGRYGDELADWDE